MASKKRKFYAVAKGKKPGIYTEWSGSSGAEAQIKGITGAQYKSFSTREEAILWLKERGGIVPLEDDQKDVLPDRAPYPDRIVVYTDGSSTGNPGPGGWGVVRLTQAGREEFSGGFRLTTNNRMELLACIEGLGGLPPDASVILYSDSQYVVNAVTMGWAQSWRKRGWMRNHSERAENSDLWGRLLDLLHDLDVEFVWVRGHDGNPGNERCDRLAAAAASRTELPEDAGYLRAKSSGQQALL